MTMVATLANPTRYAAGPFDIFLYNVSGTGVGYGGGVSGYVSGGVILTLPMNIIPVFAASAMDIAPSSQVNEVITTILGSSPSSYSMQVKAYTDNTINFSESSAGAAIAFQTVVMAMRDLG